MNKGNDAVPTGWAQATLDAIGEWKGGGTPSKANAAFWANGSIPWISPKDMKKLYLDDAEDYITDEALEKSSAQLIPPVSVLVVTRSGILQRTLPIAVNRTPVAMNQDLKALIPNESIDPHYVAYLLKSRDEDIRKECSKAGTTVASIDLPKLRSYRAPIAPYCEQRRIVAKIESLQERRSRARAALAEVAPLLEQFRRSVLSAAFSGRLTADWRAANPDVEPGSELLNRIRTERRHRWEQAQLGKYEAKGNKPPTGWQGKYSDSEPWDEAVADGFPTLPDTWCWAPLDALIVGDRKISYGVLKPGPHVENGVRFIKSGQVRDGYLDLSENFRISRKLDRQYSKTRLCGGEVLLNLVGASIGRSAVAPPELAGANVTRAIAVIPTQGKLAEWVQLALQGPLGQRLVHASVGGSAQPVLNLSDVRRLAIPLAPLDEAAAIQHRVAESFEKIAILEELMRETSSSLAQLDHSVLSKAFRGELVPQDPSDEPASEILARIRTAQE